MAISRYNEQALASAAMIQGKFREQITYVKQQLPKEDVVLEIGVERETEVGKVHQVATLHMDYTNQATIKLKLCVHKEEQVKVQQLKDVGDQPANVLARTNTNELAHMELAAPGNFKMMDTQELKHYKESKEVAGYNRCPHSMKVLEMFNTLFPQGIPVPGAQSGENLHFHYRIIVRTSNSQKLETLYKDTKTGISGISNIDSFGTGASSYTYPQLLEMHSQMTEVAAGRALPTSLEQKGTITQQSSRFAITDGKDKTEQKQLQNS